MAYSLSSYLSTKVKFGVDNVQVKNEEIICHLGHYKYMYKYKFLTRFKLWYTIYSVYLVT